jgi:hypothetical protein
MRLETTDAIRLAVAYKIIEIEYDTNYDELVDSLFNYTKAIITGIPMDVCMFRDEIENLIGIREHDEIINYILKIRGGE